MNIKNIKNNKDVIDHLKRNEMTVSVIERPSANPSKMRQVITGKKFVILLTEGQ